MVNQPDPELDMPVLYGTKRRDLEKDEHPLHFPTEEGAEREEDERNPADRTPGPEQVDEGSNNF